ncbi:MAG: Rieske 2Fe-2S domain-containing protein [Myxococcales bacterium]|nr:Rieske 2Fe-2S domain-containing protein [Myxococcales bacterium]
MSRNFQEHHTDLPIPNGWFAVAFSRDLVPGDVKAITYFDRNLVLFRARDGAARVLDAYCPHLGAHLGEGGRVMGNTVRCPFHGWQFDGSSGQCTTIPYCERIPPAARVRAWDVVEKNELIFVWHHAEGKPPQWDFPVAPEIRHPDWTEPRTMLLEVPVHSQDMHENNLDPVHFQFVHGMLSTPPTEVEYGEGGRYARIQHTSPQETPMGTFDMTLVRESWGLGLSSVRSVGIPGAGLLMYSSTSPVGPRMTHSRWVFTVTKNLADVAGEEWIANLSAGVMDDMRIWSNKVHRAEPVLCEADKELIEFRRWVKQFYSDPA